MSEAKSNTGKFIRIFAACAVLFAGILCLTVYLLDPFYHYHRPWFGLKAILTDKEYQVVGSLRNFDYDAVIVGSSVVENNNNHWYDEAYGCTTIKAVRSYGAIADLCWLLQQAQDGHELKYVFFNLDTASLRGNTSTTFKSTGCPMYLYDKNPFNDIQYLLNQDVLFEKIPYMIVQSAFGDYDEGLSYNWEEGKDFSRTGMLSHYERRAEAAEMSPENKYEEIAEKNADLLEERIEASPDTQFIFFFPAYSMLWWDSEIREGDRDADLYCERIILERLLQHDNVQVYDFQAAEEIVTDLDRYMDTIHFDSGVNYWMLQQMQTGKYRVETDTIGQYLEDTRELTDRCEQTVIRDMEKKGEFNQN